MTERLSTTDNLFLRDVLAMRSSTSTYLSGRNGKAREAHAETTIGLLQTALAIEIVCVWRYTMMSVSASGLRDHRVGAEFQEQANDERRHTQMVAERIEQLGGVPNFAPQGLHSRLTMEYGSGGDINGLIAQNLAAEQSVVEYYRDLIVHFSATDPETSAILEQILEDEENHATDLHDLLGRGTRAH